MLDLTAFLTVLIASIALVEEVYSKPQQGTDIELFLQALQQQLQQDDKRELEVNQEPQNPPPSYIYDDDEEDLTYRYLRSGEVDQLIEQERYKERNRNRYREQSRQEHDDNYRNNVNLLQELISLRMQGRNNQRQKKNHQISKLLDLPHEDRSSKPLPFINYDDVRNEHSKVYLILNPDALQKSRNKDKLNDVLSNLLSSRQRDRRERRRDRLNNGYVVRHGDLMRRRMPRNRDSNEKFADENSVEKEYKPKPKRSQDLRGEQGGRGGGGGRGSGGGRGGGRTAIPYIGNRGNIYERDN